MVAGDEQVDQDDRESAVLDDHVAREAVLYRVPDQAAVERRQQSAFTTTCSIAVENNDPSS